MYTFSVPLLYALIRMSNDVLLFSVLFHQGTMTQVIRGEKGELVSDT